VGGGSGEDGDSSQPDSDGSVDGAVADAAVDAAIPYDAKPCVLPPACSFGEIIDCGDGVCRTLCISPKGTWGVGAEVRCAQAGGHLVTIDTLSESECIGNVLTIGRVAWTGYFQDSGGSEPASGWAWISNPNPLPAFVNWDTGQPNDANPANGGQDCAVIEPNGKWNDGECSTPQEYVCEF
jgi:hypothetical protein